MQGIFIANNIAEKYDQEEGEKLKKAIMVLLVLAVIAGNNMSVKAYVPGRAYFDAKNNNYMYIVKSGDTLYNIARIFKISLEELQGLNYDVKPEALRVGDKLIIRINKKLKFHFVRAGDTIWGISHSSGLSANDIIAYNQLENPSYIIPGELIFLPDIIAENRNIKIMGFEKKYGTAYVSGIARIFEATVSYAFESRDRKVLKEGFTTASVGAPDWGRFDIQDTIPGGAQIIAVFSISPKDSSRQDLIRLDLNNA